MKTVTKHDLIRDLGIVVEDLESILRESANSASEKAVAARKRAEVLVNALKARIAEAKKSIPDKAVAAAEEIDHYVRDHAWETIAAAAKAGVFLGMLLEERKHKAVDEKLHN
jgi:ElaB/YqjD/DUF883 family membrane-anchored ribosome-binding protein